MNPEYGFFFSPGQTKKFMAVFVWRIEIAHGNFIGRTACMCRLSVEIIKQTLFIAERAKKSLKRVRNFPLYRLP